MPDRLEERLSRLPKGWDVVPLGGLPTARLIGYGITRPGEHTDSGVGMVRAADVRNGRLHNGEPKRISRQVHEASLRSQLEVGDVVVVLVGRVGEAAVVTEEFHHWNASRTVGIIRPAEPGDAAWLKLWLGSPDVREWCERRTTGSTLQRTLSLAALRDLPVPIPPAAPRAAFLRAMSLLEAKTATNVRIAECATELTDAQFMVENRNSEVWPGQPFGTLAELAAADAPRPPADKDGMPKEDGIPFVAPGDILQSDKPHLYRTERRLPLGQAGSECAPASLLVASREDGVRAVMNRVPVAVGRGVLVLRPKSVIDGYWLLHEIRSRGIELVAAAQGSAGRELSRRAFGATQVRWPPQDVRERFARLADRLQARARTAHAENETLRVLRGQALDGFLAGSFGGMAAM